ncbi:MAG: hypothetical protein AAF390_14975 [Pseudomonadota bacterium]
MSDEDRIERLLAEAAADATPLPRDLRAAILADAAAAGAPSSRWTWLAGLAAGLPAAATGLWLGLAQPALVLQVVPGLTAPAADMALLDEVFGTWEDDG